MVFKNICVLRTKVAFELEGFMLQVLVSAKSPLAGWLGRYINVRRCGRLSEVLLQLFEDPLELFVKRREFLPGSRFPSCHNMTYGVVMDTKNNSLLSFSQALVLSRFLRGCPDS